MRTTSIGIIALTALVLTAAGARVAVAEEGATLAALKLAHEREVNSQWHYLAFASGARREGYADIARLFTAIACAEQIHAANHRAQLERLGGVPAPRIESVVVRSTAENLARAIELERIEHDAVYRAFADFARKECDYEALASFNYARDAEGTHGAMFARALERLRERTARPRLLASLFPVADPGAVFPAIYVCRGCGSAFPAVPARSCPNCGTTCAIMRVFF
jgi:rubrerythrin